VCHAPFVACTVCVSVGVRVRVRQEFDDHNHEVIGSCSLNSDLALSIFTLELFIAYCFCGFVSSVLHGEFFENVTAHTE